MKCLALAIVILFLLPVILLELRVAFHLGTHEHDEQEDVGTVPLSRVWDVQQYVRHRSRPSNRVASSTFPKDQAYYYSDTMTATASRAAAIILPTNAIMSMDSTLSSTRSDSDNNNSSSIKNEHNNTTSSSSCPDDDNVDSVHSNHSRRRVPRIIHQTYKSHDLPPNFQMWREECQRLNPCWEFKLWTDDDNLKFVQKEFPSFLPIYTGYKAKIKRIDSVRYLILYLYGGVYFDLDMTCLRPFQDGTFDKDDTLYVANQFDADVPPDLARRRYANAFMAASPRHSVLAELIDHLPSKRHKGVLKATGPRLLTGVLERTTLNASIVVFKKEELFSTSYSDTEGIELCATNRTACMARYPGYMVSFWSSTWTHPDFEDGK